jgi:hypothetical protein
MKLIVQIQSVSDIITNSSSEVFCTITGKDIEAVYQVLEPFFPGDSEMEPTISYYEKGEWDDEDSPPQVIIWMPYGFGGITTFYRAGLKAFLDQAIGENNYSIDYEF